MGKSAEALRKRVADSIARYGAIEKMCEKTGYSRNAIKAWATEHSNPRLDAIEKMAKALGQEPWQLLRPEESAKPSLAPAPLPFADLEKELRKLGHGHALNFLKGWITEVREFNQILQERQAGKDPSQGETD